MALILQTNEEENEQENNYMVKDSLFGGDGYSAKEVFQSKNRATGYTYDDLIMLPGHISFGVDDIHLGTKLTKKILYLQFHIQIYLIFHNLLLKAMLENLN